MLGATRRATAVQQQKLIGGTNVCVILHTITHLAFQNSTLAQKRDVAGAVATRSENGRGHPWQSRERRARRRTSRKQRAERGSARAISKTAQQLVFNGPYGCSRATSA